MDDIKDHFIPHKFEKKTMLEMFDALVSLYESENINMNMILHNIFICVEMTGLDRVTDNLMIVTHIYDQLETIVEQVEDKEILNWALNGFPSQWE